MSRDLEPAAGDAGTERGESSRPSGSSYAPNPGLPAAPTWRDRRPALLNLTALPPCPGERRRVLVVDDEPGMRYMARRVLEPAFEVHEAESGEEALRILEGEAFHVAVVDVRLPGLSGLDLLTALKGCCPSTDVIVMTGSAIDMDEALEGAIRRKAFFFLRKPFPMTVLETLVERVAETQELEERLVSYARALETNLESARIFQRRLLPASPWSAPGIRVASKYRPSERLSGDFFDYWQLPQEGTAILVVDVMGHGPPAAMITGIVKSHTHRLAEEIRDPGDVLVELEEELSRIALPSFLTALLVFDLPSEGRVLYAGAGHPPGLAARPESLLASAMPLEPLVSTGIPINTGLPIGPRETRALSRVPGLRLLLYTDGYPEATSRSGEPFDGGVGEDGREATATLPYAEGSPFMMAASAALSAETPERGIAGLEAALHAHTLGADPDDDRAAVLAWFL